VLARRSDDFISGYSEEEQRSQRRKGPGFTSRISGFEH